METVQWFIWFLLLNGTLIAAAVNTQLNYTKEDVEQDIFASICSFSFRGSCNSRDFYYSVFKERDGSPTNTESTSMYSYSEQLQLLMSDYCTQLATSYSYSYYRSIATYSQLFKFLGELTGQFWQTQPTEIFICTFLAMLAHMQLQCLQ